MAKATLSPYANRRLARYACGELGRRMRRGKLNDDQIARLARIALANYDRPNSKLNRSYGCPGNPLGAGKPPAPNGLIAVAAVPIALSTPGWSSIRVRTPLGIASELIRR